MRACPSNIKTHSNVYIYRHVRLSFPSDLLKEMVKAHGPKLAEEICQAQNERALLTVRANTIKTTRDEVKNYYQYVLFS